MHTLRFIILHTLASTKENELYSNTEKCAFYPIIKF